MKKIHLNKLISICFVFTALVFASCSNLLDNIENENNGKGSAKISLSVGLKNLEGNSAEENNSRTVMAAASDNTTVSNLKNIKLYAKLSSDSKELGTEESLLTEWADYSEFNLVPYSKEMQDGTYDFMLTATNYGATMTQTLSSITLSAGSTTPLNFTSLAVSEAGEQTGVIDLTIYYDKKRFIIPESFEKYIGSSYEKYAEISISLDGNLIALKDSSTSKISTYTLFTTTDDNGNGYTISMDGAYLNTAPVNAGFHIVTITFTAIDGTVFVYPVPVYVQAGYLSKGSVYPLSGNEVTKDDNVQSYTVTYNSNTDTEETKTQTFYKGSLLADAEALGFTGTGTKRFKEWNTQKDGSGTSYTEGTSPELTEDITLYAQWGDFYKVTYLINLDSNTQTYIQKVEAEISLATSKTAFADFDSLKYQFCGWDTKADGSGTRYAEGASLTLTEDTILYAQWCGAKDSYDYYVVENAKQWNALMGAPFANTSDGIISADVYIPSGKTISSPALSLTSTKTFSGRIEGYFHRPIEGFKGALFDSLSADSEINSLTVKGLVCNTNNGSIVDIKVNAPVCNTNNGTISNVTVSGITMTGYSGIARINSSNGTISSCTVSSCTITGSGDYAGAICGRNMGTIEDCTVSNCTIDGSTNNVSYTGGICGYNEGTISGSSTKVTGTVTGSTSDYTYTGGYCAYNTGTISDSGSIDITLSGSSEADSYYGYVIGYNDGGTVSTDITTTAQETVVDTGTITVDGSKYFDFTLERTSLATVSFTDTAANAAQLNAYLRLLTETGTVSKTLVSCSDIDNTTVTKKLYLSKGSYSIYLSEGYITSNKGCSAKVLID
ncbi:MAG: InlB B-repeat-containing protein [Treponema porcinum]|uniref:InlB B-repeat-containing protein n=1 Tax=Treponema porcinum TaxID=261392 RepID=UPI002A8262E5|nr:InlB B-repeat-containing protein [Treponema porcinum]MDY5121214.1 InlB B-repeat-containing protein [Treponema porcinum]